VREPKNPEKENDFSTAPDLSVSKETVGMFR